MKKLILFFSAAALLLTGCCSNEEQVQNVIFLIGDGMGLTTVSAYSMEYMDEAKAFEQAEYIGLQKTYSASSRVTDSAASGTALACGQKTNNGVIGQDGEGNHFESSLVVAQKRGMATGLVTTCPITDATPAAFYAHAASRGMQVEIAEQLVDAGVDVIAGEGIQYFNGSKSERNLIEEFQAKGYTYAADKAAFMEIANTPAVMIVDEYPFCSDDKDGVRGDYLSEATAKALELLENTGKNGFFLMVEGSKIDWAGHGNNSAASLGEVRDFDKAIKVAFDYADTHPGTLVVITGDHETGGMAIKADYETGGIDITWITNGHTGTFLPIYAYGTGAENFKGVMENTDISKKMKQLIDAK